MMLVLLSAAWLMALLTSWTPSTTDTSSRSVHKNSSVSSLSNSTTLSRRSALRLALVIAAATLQPAKKAEALTCCCCEYQSHYDPLSWNCCGDTGRAYHLHHYWRRCYNICTGQKGDWHRIVPDNCECDCQLCHDSTWVAEGCCYAIECCCNMGICECGCPC